MNFFKSLAVLFYVVGRVLIALLGGYLLANLVAIFISTLTILILPTENKINSIVAGLMTSFIIYALAVIFVFSAKTVLRSFVVILGACLVIFSLITSINMTGKV
jgi:hypothetical protein